MSKSRIIQNGIEYGNKIRKHLKNSYNIENVEFINCYSWGFNTSAFYIHIDENTKYTARISSNLNKGKNLLNDIYWSNKLKSIVTTSEFIKDRFNNEISFFGNSYFRLSKHIEGTAPFEMNFEIFDQIIEKLTLIHNFEIKGKECLIHGDTTPSNFLVSYEKLVGILDFEETRFGYPEEDFGKLTIFSSTRDIEKSFLDYLDRTLSKSPYLDRDKIIHFAKISVKKYIENLENNKKTPKYMIKDAEVMLKELNLA